MNARSRRHQLDGRKATVPLLILLGLGACAPTEPPSSTPYESAAGIIDPVTGRLTDISYAETRISLAQVIENETNAPIDDNDRRFIDSAFDKTLKADPNDGPVRWQNPANDRSGEVDLKQWLADPRRDAACGIINHATKLGRTHDPLKGSLTICRYRLDLDWQVDTASFERPPAQPSARPKAPAPAATPKPAPAPSSSTAKPRPIEEPAPTASDPNRVITRTPDDIVPPSSAGQQNIGDLLQDQAPHTPAK